jgi:lariat debranching enzyme
MAVPAKYRSMGDFYSYYKGEKVAPILTLFIHGNHEAGNHLQELYAGGWVAPNIYFMGYSNVLKFGGLRIGGLGGIFRDKYYHRGYFEKAPYDAESLRSVYYVREYEVWKLKHFKSKIDLFFSHDWPLGIYHAQCDLPRLIRTKPFFEQEIKSNTLGSLANQEVLRALKPAYWFSAHLHVKFAAIVDHSSDGSGEQTTKFLALDKCLPRRDYLQILEFPDVPESEKKLSYDPEWLAILKESLKYYSTSRHPGVHPAELYACILLLCHYSFL